MVSRGDEAVAVRFGQNLRRERRRAGLSQGGLARLTSLHPTAISLLERGQRTPRISTVVRLCSAISVDANALFDGIRWTASEQVQPEGHFSVRGGQAG